MRYVFGNHTLDVERRELLRGGERVAVEPQVFDLLLYLVRNRDRVVTKDDLLQAVWNGRIISESAMTTRINAARRAVGDTGKDQQFIRTIARKGLRFVADVSEAGQASAGSNESRAAAAMLPLRQDVRFCVAPDDVRVAYAEVGQGLPIIKAANWLNHLEYDWQSPIWSPLLRSLAAEHHLVRYDARGNGLSDWDVAEISLDAFVRDLESVVEATGIDRFALLGISQGGAVSVSYAVRHPERVSHLIIYGGFARGRRRRGSPEDAAQADAMLTLIRQGWGQENPAFRQMFTSLFVPGGAPEQMQWFNDLQRMTASPENAARIRSAADDIDVTDLLGQVRVPTLVLHCRDDAVQPFEEGRRLAAGIPGARFVALEGRNHLILEGDPGWARLLDEIRDFLAT